MVFRTFVGLLVSFCLVASFSARAMDELSINPSHPNQYTVVQGDTLWDISAKFLNHPTQWPELWRHNSQIKNPHLIYPGDTVYFSVVDGRPRLSFSPNPDATYQGDDRGMGNGTCTINEEDIHQGRTAFAKAQGGKLSPCIRETTMKQAIRLIPAEDIAKFLTSPRVVSANELDKAPYVLDFSGEHMAAAPGDKLYVRSIIQPQSQTFTVYRPGQTFKTPETGEVLGYEARYVGDSTLVEEGDPATVTIDKSVYEVLVGDRLMPKAEEQFNLNYFPRPPEDSIRGSIIYVLDGVNQIGKSNVVVVDKGIRDGLQPGHELDILKRGRVARDPYSTVRNDEVKLPDEIIGTLMIFRTFDRVSYALVMKVKQAVHVYDRVRTP